MKDFARLCEGLRAALQPPETALAAYLGAAPDADRLWALALLSGRRPKRLMRLAELGQLAAEVARVPDWLLQDCRREVGDIAEMAALLVPPADLQPAPGLSHWLDSLQDLAGADGAGRRAWLTLAWGQLGQRERILLNRLATGTFRQSLTPSIQARALAAVLGRSDADMAQKLSRNWSPQTGDFATWFLTPASVRPSHAFAPEARLTGGPEPLGLAGDWLGWRHRPGQRAQLIVEHSGWHLWTAAAERLGPGLPQIAALADQLPPGTVLEGVLSLPDGSGGWADGPQRQSRDQKPGAKADAAARLDFWPDDLLEWQGTLQTTLPYEARRARLDALGMTRDPVHHFADWAEAQAAKTAVGAEGLVLRHRRSDASASMRWLWPSPPQVVTAMLIYCETARAGRAARYSFALQDGPDLVAIGPAPADGLSAAEQAELATWIARHTTQRFGPVRQVAAELRFDLGFDRVSRSGRRKSGLALEGLRILCWRQDEAALISQIAPLRALAER